MELVLLDEAGGIATVLRGGGLTINKTHLIASHEKGLGRQHPLYVSTRLFVQNEGFVVSAFMFRCQWRLH
jgi:hypothetical protein